MVAMKAFATVFVLLLACVRLHAAVIYDQPAATLALGSGYASAVNTTDNPTYQNRLRDRFRLATAATIREIRWRGTFKDSAPVSFTVKIFDFTVGSAVQLYLPPVASFTIAGTAGQSPAGTFNGAPMFDYRFVLPTPFAALGNNKDYWVKIIAQQTGVPDWSWAVASGGDGSHFVRLNGPFTDSGYYGYGSGDCAFTSGSLRLSASGAGSTVKIVRQPNHGTVAVTGLVATYYAELGYVGPDYFAYAASDSGGYVDSATVGIVSVTVGGYTTALDTDGDVCRTSWNTRSAHRLISQP